MRFDLSDTIVAIASPPGGALRGIVRLSGPGSNTLALSLFEAEDARAWPDRPSHRTGRLRVSAFTRPIPVRLLRWPGSSSFTGQTSCEIHCVGSPPILHAIVTDLLTQGARLAEPGEFTLRAFLSGKIDLTRAEAIRGLIEARSEAQFRVALNQLAGGIVKPIESLRSRLLDLLARVEADLDFSDEPDVSALERSIMADQIAEAASAFQAMGRSMDTRDRREGRPKVLLYGPPNAGKSRLFNALVDRDAALVSSQPGTTRDYLSSTLRLRHIEVELIDSAGVEEPRDEIERHAARSRDRQRESADLIIHCQPADETTPSPIGDQGPTLRVLTKSDLTRNADARLRTGAETGEGLEKLRDAIEDRLADSDGGVVVASTAQRCREALIRGAESLHSAGEALRLGSGDELVAIDLRQALDSLGRVAGETTTDEILDRIFGQFCIGK